MFKFLMTAVASLFIATTGVNAIDLPKDFIGKAPPAITESQASEKPAVADPDYRVVITSDFGGSVIEYIQKYNKMRQDGSKVRIDDLCMSACTLATGLLADANVCVSRYAIMAFHSAWVMSFAGPMHSPEGTALLWNIYPEKVKEKLREAGWNGTDPHPNFIYFKGTDFYPECA